MWAGLEQLGTWKVREPEIWEAGGKSHVRLEQLLKEQEVAGSWVANSNGWHNWQLISSVWKMGREGEREGGGADNDAFPGNAIGN